MQPKIPLLRLEYSDEDVEFIKEGVVSVLKSGYLTMDRNVAEFERLFAEYCGVKYALGTNSGTSALEIPLRTLDVEGGVVVMPSNTYMATPLAAIKAGAKVAFADCERDTLQMDPDDFERRITPDVKAAIIVHIAGIISPSIERIAAICKSRGIPLIEDAAHAHGAEFKGRRAGTFGVSAGFSFYPTKVLTTAEGGMVVTNDKSLHEKGKVLREHGKADHGFNVHTEIGDNWRFSELHALLGLQQMRKADHILYERRRLAKIYDALLDSRLPSLGRLKLPPESNPSYYKYVVFLPDGVGRAELKRRMSDEFGVALTGEVYSNPCHSQPVFTKYPRLLASDASDSYPGTDYVCSRQICLPLYPGLRDEEAAYVVESLAKAL